MEKIEAQLDKPDSICKYGLIEGGDGKLYRAARGGFNERGRRLDDLMKKIFESAEEGGDRSAAYSAARELFVTALEPFYSPNRIDQLLECGCFSWSDTTKLCVIIAGDEVTEVLSKKE